MRAAVATLHLLAIALAAVTIAGCSSQRDVAAPSSSSSSTDNAQSGAEAKIHINYSRSEDYLGSMTVTKYSSSEILKTINTKDGAAAVVRFEGGILVWAIAVEKSMMSGVPLIGHAEHRYSPLEVKYGDLPDHFVESMPSSGPPEPLEPDHYYIFAANRGSGSISYEAVKVNGDGSLEAYDADPRAGSSFWLCCNLVGDFTITAPAP